MVSKKKGNESCPAKLSQPEFIPRRSARLRNAGKPKTSYFDTIPVHVAAIIAEKAMIDAGQRKAVPVALALPNDAVAYALGTITEGTDGVFQTIGEKAYKDLKSLLCSIGKSVRKLKFKEKKITKKYSKLVKAHCPNVEKLSVEIGPDVNGMIYNPKLYSNRVDYMLKALTHNKPQLNEFHLSVHVLLQYHLSLLMINVQKVNTIVLEFDSVANDLYDLFWLCLWEAAGEGDSRLKKIILINPELKSTLEPGREPIWLCLANTKVLCPELKIEWMSQREKSESSICRGY